MKESILINSISKPVHFIRLELQTLRAIAIAFVLAFHLWGSVFKNGYLGVDM
jgi:peptidoglycan/LPS O-acetylase OafA/YrhL